MLHREKLDELVLLHLGLKAPPADLKDWEKLVGRMISPKHRVKVAMVGKYLGVPDAYKSVTEALFHAASGEDTGVVAVIEHQQHGVIAHWLHCRNRDIALVRTAVEKFATVAAG